MANETAKLISLPEERQMDINHVLKTATEESKDFAGVFIVAVVDLGGGDRSIRLYYGGLNRLERGGVLQEAADMVRNPEE